MSQLIESSFKTPTRYIFSTITKMALPFTLYAVVWEEVRILNQNLQFSIEAKGIIHQPDRMISTCNQQLRKYIKILIISTTIILRRRYGVLTNYQNSKDNGNACTCDRKKPGNAANN